MSKLAINGGAPIRTRPFPNMSTQGMDEREAVMRVFDSNCLSGFRGNYSRFFEGGPEIEALQRAWEKKFDTKHAVAVNSCTSGLHIACGAIGLKPGDEVIVTPWSMSCSATAPMIYGATPVFADIEENYYCLDPESIRKKITPNTKAIIVVDLFGSPHDVKAIREIADEYGLYVIEDAAQAIGSKHIGSGRMTGTFGDIGVFSFTQGKHLVAGEGGMMMTDDPEIAMKCKLLLNHAEAVINDMDGAYPGELDEQPSTSKMVGFNMRMTEMQAAIMRCQLAKLDFITQTHIDNSSYIASILNDIPSIFSPQERHGYTHSYYVQAFKWINDQIHRDTFIDAVIAEIPAEEGREQEGVMGKGYIKPLYRFPAFKSRGYDQSQCPVAEKLWKDQLFLHRLTGLNLTLPDLNDLCNAFIKVWECREELM